MPLPKGRTNNPNGRPRVDDCAAAAIRKVLKKKDWEAAAKSLLSVLVLFDECGESTGLPNPLSSGKEKAAAYVALTDRAYGKPVQKQINIEEKTPPIDSETLDTIRSQIVGDA